MLSHGSAPCGATPRATGAGAAPGQRPAQSRRCSALRRAAASAAPREAAPAAPACVVRPARGESEFRRVSRLIRENFYPKVSASSPLGRFMEWDRALGLQFAHKGVPAGSRFECLVAEAAPTAAEADAARRWARQQLASGAEGGRAHTSGGGGEEQQAASAVVACASVDTLPGRFERRVPSWPWPLPVPALLGLTPAGCAPREARLAYVSSLCVAASHRRRGVATALLRAAEEQAQAWGCAATTLHCAEGDAPLRAMYRAAGYRYVATEPAWAPPLQLRSTRLALFCKRLPRAIADDM